MIGTLVSLWEGLGRPILRCYVSFREVTCVCNIHMEPACHLFFGGDVSHHPPKQGSFLIRNTRIQGFQVYNEKMWRKRDPSREFLQKCYFRIIQQKGSMWIPKTRSKVLVLNTSEKSKLIWNFISPKSHQFGGSAKQHWDISNTFPNWLAQIQEVKLSKHTESIGENAPPKRQSHEWGRGTLTPSW